ncbi:MAG: hypothetical protein KDD62_01525 [Bdellovibrionales bacterium]|nr:hypothetical protein [Bdellovibrionales bacterium]
MRSDKIKTFMQLAGQAISNEFVEGDDKTRMLGAQLLLSEVLEYCVQGLGVEPEVNGVRITKPNDLQYRISDSVPVSKKEMLDGLADVAYTMYWNAEAFGIPLEEGFELVCDNNLEKFVELDAAKFHPGALERDQWGCCNEVTWPAEVVNVTVVEVASKLYAVGTDASGKVRKPSTYQSVDLSRLLGV